MALFQHQFGDDLFSQVISGFPTGHLVNFEQEAGKSLFVKSIPLDIVENDKGYSLKADIPGVEKQNIKLNVENDVLSLSVEQSTQKEEEKEENGTRWHRSERSSTYKKRSVRLPENASMDNIQAKYENGVLIVDIPKTEVQHKQRQVTIA